MAFLECCQWARVDKLNSDHSLHEECDLCFEEEAGASLEGEATNTSYSLVNLYMLWSQPLVSGRGLLSQRSGVRLTWTDRMKSSNFRKDMLHLGVEGG